MCGIIGVCGKSANAKKVTLNGLEKLEYRGYDSAGIALLYKNKITLKKQVGMLNNLKESIKDLNAKATCGIGHTRWATHGKPSIKNCHPHKSPTNNFYVVHNGIIENYSLLKEQLETEGFVFKTNTDTEVIAYLLEHLNDGDFVNTVGKTVKKLKGSFALAIINKNNENQIMAVRNFSPLVVCKNKDNLYLASDLTALSDYTNKMYILDNKELALLDGNKNKITFFNFKGKQIEKTYNLIDAKTSAVTKNGFSTFMQKEINEIPKKLFNCLSYYISPQFEEPKLINQLKKVDFVYFVACGTAYHAGLVGSHLIENILGIKTKAVVASEFRYNNPPINKNTLCVFISQSGETADTLEALNKAKSLSAKILAITNVETSTITRLAGIILPTKAGVEIAVASTKAYNTQVMVMFLLTLYFAKAKEKETGFVLKELYDIFDASQTLVNEDQTANIIPKVIEKTNVFFIGRGLDNLTAQEGSLKLKEISYINSEAYPAGELKHGTLALIDDNSLVVAIITEKELKQKTLNAVHEVKARGAKVLIVSQLNFEKEEYDFLIKLPHLNKDLMPIISVIPLFQFALNFSLSLGLNPDKPRNLAKSVTVE